MPTTRICEECGYTKHNAPDNVKDDLDFWDETYCDGCFEAGQGRDL